MSKPFTQLSPARRASGAKTRRSTWYPVAHSEPNGANVSGPVRAGVSRQRSAWYTTTTTVQMLTLLNPFLEFPEYRRMQESDANRDCVEENRFRYLYFY